MFRFMFVWGAILALVSTCVSAHYAQPPGYSQGILPLPLGGTGNAVWDVNSGFASGQVYLWNDGDFRRVDPTTGSVAANGLFGSIPAGQDSFDCATIDPANPAVVFASFSTFVPAASTIYVYTRSGADAATQGASQGYGAYTAINTTATMGEDVAIYRMRFAPDLPTVPASLRGKLIVAGADTAPGLGLGSVKLWAMDTNAASPDYLQLTELATVLNAGASGAMTCDADGNVYTVVGFGSPATVVRYDGMDLSDALTGVVAPVTPAAANVVIAPSDGVTGVSALAVRNEESVKYMYYGESNTGSIFRRNLVTGGTKLWAQGFGPVDNFNYWGGASSIEFESLTNDFRPHSSGNTRLAVTFTIGAVNTAPFQFGNIVSEFHFFGPQSTNPLVSALSVTQSGPDIERGSEFEVTLEALNGSGTPITSNVSVEVALTTGGGSLDGFLVHTGAGDSLVVSDLIYNSPSTGTETIDVTFTVVGTATSETLSLNVVPASTGGGTAGGNNNNDNNDNGGSSGCVAADGDDHVWLLALSLLSCIGVVSRLRRARV